MAGIYYTSSGKDLSTLISTGNLSYLNYNKGNLGFENGGLENALIGASTFLGKDVRVTTEYYGKDGYFINSTHNPYTSETLGWSLTAYTINNASLGISIRKTDNSNEYGIFNVKNSLTASAYTRKAQYLPFILCSKGGSGGVGSGSAGGGGGGGGGVCVGYLNLYKLTEPFFTSNINTLNTCDSYEIIFDVDGSYSIKYQNRTTGQTTNIITISNGTDGGKASGSTGGTNGTGGVVNIQNSDYLYDTYYSFNGTNGRTGSQKEESGRTDKTSDGIDSITLPQNGYKIPNFFGSSKGYPEKGNENDKNGYTGGAGGRSFIGDKLGYGHGGRGGNCDFWGGTSGKAGSVGCFCFGNL